MEKNEVDITDHNEYEKEFTLIGNGFLFFFKDEITASVSQNPDFFKQNGYLFSEKKKKTGNVAALLQWFKYELKKDQEYKYEYPVKFSSDYFYHCMVYVFKGTGPVIVLQQTKEAVLLKCLGEASSGLVWVWGY